MEPLWVKVSEKSTVLRAKAFNQLTLEILENSTECFAYLLLILDAAPVCPD